MTRLFCGLLLLPIWLSVVQASTAPPSAGKGHIYLSPPNPTPYVNGAQTFTASVAGTSQQELVWSDTCADPKSGAGFHDTYVVSSHEVKSCAVTVALKSDPTITATSNVRFIAGPVPSTSHPRLSITPQIIATMKAAGWNKTRNPSWRIMLTNLDTARTETDKKWCFTYMKHCPNGSTPGQPINWVGAFPTGKAGPNQWTDTGGTQGPTFDATEAYAKFYAWMAQFIDDPAQKANLKAASHEMIMWALTMADNNGGNGPITPQNCGHKVNAFRECGIAFGNRPHQTSGETWAQAVDLNYDSYSAADLKIVRDVFSAWANLNETSYVTGFGCLSPYPPAVGNAAVPADRKCLRWEMNNLGSATYNMSFNLAEILDAKDDPPNNPALPWNAFSVSKGKDGTVLTVNSLRGYGYLNQAGWTYLKWLLVEDPGITSKLTGLEPAGLGEGQGGGSPESSEYSPNFGYTFMALWAMHTAGLDDPTSMPGMNLGTSSAWDNTVWYFLNSIAPNSRFTDSYMGYNYDISVYGDNGSPYGFQTQNAKSLVPIGLRDMYATHDPVELNAVRWLMKYAFYGGCGNNSNGACGRDSAYYARRMKATVGANNFQGVTDLFMVLGDPTATACDPNVAGCNPSGDFDPRTDRDYNHDWHAPGWGKTYSRTTWKSGPWFIDGCSWVSIDHQAGDCGQTELWYGGNFVFSPFTTYMNPVSSATDWKGAGMLIPNPDNGPDQTLHASPNYLQWTSMMAARGAEMTQITQATPKVLEYSAPDYTTQYQESTDERNYKHWNVKADNVAYAARTDVFLKDSAIVVVYDTGKTVRPLASGLHKSVAFDTVDMPTVTGQVAKLAHGSLTTIIPEGSDYSVLVCAPPKKGGEAAPGNCNGGVQGPSPARFMTTITSASNADHFLNVLEGSNAGVTPTKKISAQSGAAIDGVEIDGKVNAAVSFLREPVVHGGEFTTVTYQVPSSVTAHYLVGLKPNTSYSYQWTSNNGVDTFVVSAKASGVSTVTSDATGLIHFLKIEPSARASLAENSHLH